MAKYSLLVGVNKYAEPGNDLNGCVNDITGMWDRLTGKYGFPADSLRMLADQRAIQQSILERLGWLVGLLKSGDIGLWHYSGHGSQVRDRDGDELDDKLDEILCVSGDTLISTDKGLVHADRLHKHLQRGEQIQAKVGDKWHKITNSARTEKEEVISIRMENGLHLTFGINHPVMIFDDGVVKQKKAEDLQPNDCALFPCGPWRGETKIDKIWYLIGLYVGDGHFLTDSSIRFGVRAHKEFWHTIAEMARTALPDAEVRASENARGDLNVVIRSRILASLLRGLGFKPHQRKTGRISELPIPMNEACVKGFIRGLFDSDGTSAKRQVSFGTTDYELCKIVLILLGFFGVRGQIASRHHLKYSTAYNISLYGYHALKFLDRIGFGIDEKQNRFDRTLYPRSGEIGRIEMPELKSMLDRWNFSYYDFAESIGLNKRNHRRIKTASFTRELATASIAYLQSKVAMAENASNENRGEFGASIAMIERESGVNQYTAYDQLQRGDLSSLKTYATKMVESVSAYANRDWDLLDNYDVIRVIGVERVPTIIEMYDFTVDGAAKFEANGILVHNCPHDLNWDDPFTDDRIAEFFKKVPQGAKMIFISDSCHSGTIDRAFGPSNPHPTKSRYLPPPIDIAYRAVGRKLPVKKIGHKGVMVATSTTPARAGSPYPNVTFIPQNHILLSGCRDDQTSADAYINGKYQGALTAALMNALDSNPSNWIELHQRVCAYLAQNGYSQVPQLSGREDLLRGTIF